jgi:hypothetical protein
MWGLENDVVVRGLQVFQDTPMPPCARGTRAGCVSPTATIPACLLEMAESRAPRHCLRPCDHPHAFHLASFLTMHESITSMSFPGHCQRWGTLRTRIEAGVLRRHARSLAWSHRQHRDRALDETWRGRQQEPYARNTAWHCTSTAWAIHMAWHTRAGHASRTSNSSVTPLRARGEA